MEAQPPPYPADPSTGYPAPQQQPGYPDPAAAAQPAGYPAQGYVPQTDVKSVDAYGQPVVAGGYPQVQQPPGVVDAYGQPVVTGGYPQQPPGYTAQQNATTVVVAQQPAVVTQVNPGIRPNNYLVLSIVNLLFCFFILGLIALIFSLQVDSAWSSGRYEEARRSSNIAKVLNYIGIGVGIGSWVIVGIIIILRIVLSVAVAAS